MRKTLYALAAASLAAAVTVGPAGGAYPGKNGRIAFAAGNRLAEFEIYTVAADGTGPKKLTSNSVLDGTPVFSPDGRRIAFGRDVGGRTRLWVMSADGSGQTQLSLSSTKGFDGEPTWSPDGKQIAFVSSRNGIAQLFAMSAGGGSARQLTAETSAASNPAWAPKGDAIAFVRNGDIFLRTDAGTKRLTATPDFAEVEPAWSPDGKQIAFLSNREQAEDEEGSGFELYVMNADGNGAKRLTSGPSDFGHAAWAPDGSAIAFTRFVGGGELALFTISPSGGEPKRAGGKLPQLPVRLDWGPAPGSAEPARADVGLTLTGGSATSQKGVVLTTYELAVRNDGPDLATGLRLTIDLAGNAELWGTKPGSWRCAAAKTKGKWQLACTLAQLAKGAKAPLAVTLRSRRAESAAARLFAASLDPNLRNNDAALLPRADLAVGLNRSGPRRELEFVSVTNYGPLKATGVVLQFTELYDFQLQKDGKLVKCAGPRQRRCELGDIAPGETVRLLFHSLVVGHKLTHTYRVSAGSPADPNLRNNTAP